MQRFTDQQYLTLDQYKDSRNLDTRIEIHKRFSANPQGWFNWVFDTLAQLPENASVLELGCGAGTIWRECADRIPANWAITLTDLSDGMLDTAWRNLIVTKHNYKFEKVDAQSIPFADKAFDAILANHMLYHVPDRAKALREIKRVLKDDGRLIATTVGENHMQEMYVWLKQVNINPRPDMFSNPFTLENGTEQLRNTFSQVEKSHYKDNLRITEIEPIIAYLRSSIGADDVSENELKKIENELSAVLKKEGEIFITKDSGLFKVAK